MNPAYSLSVVKQTALVLLPEIFLLSCAIVMMVGSAFKRQPRRYWFTFSQISSLLAIVLLLLGGRSRTAIYSAVALNDDLSFYARLVLLCSGAIILALAHREPDDERAGEFFGA